MEKITITLWDGGKRRLVAVNLYEAKDTAEVRTVIGAVQATLARHFPHTEIALYGKAKEFVRGYVSDQGTQEGPETGIPQRV